MKVKMDFKPSPGMQITVDEEPVDGALGGVTGVTIYVNLIGTTQGKVPRAEVYERLFALENAFNELTDGRLHLSVEEE